MHKWVKRAGIVNNGNTRSNAELYVEMLLL
jgi:hypothetical protein